MLKRFNNSIGAVTVIAALIAFVSCSSSNNSTGPTPLSSQEAYNLIQPQLVAATQAAIGGLGLEHLDGIDTDVNPFSRITPQEKIAGFDYTAATEPVYENGWWIISGTIALAIGDLNWSGTLTDSIQFRMQDGSAQEEPDNDTDELENRLHYDALLSWPENSIGHVAHGAIVLSGVNSDEVTANGEQNQVLTLAIKSEEGDQLQGTLDFMANVSDIVVPNEVQGDPCPLSGQIGLAMDADILYSGSGGTASYNGGWNVSAITDGDGTADFTVTGSGGFSAEFTEDICD